jgi:hypothetical protein
MAERAVGHGWTFLDTDRRQLLSGLEMTPAERLAWLEEMLDELLPMLGCARRVADGSADELAEQPEDAREADAFLAAWADGLEAEDW